MVWWLLAACAPQPACAEGFEAGEDGLCYEVPVEVTVADLLEGLPACAPAEGEGLDLEAGCVGEACLGMSRAAVEEELGAPDGCEALIFDIACSWMDDAVGFTFGDEDEDGEADAGELAVSLSVELGYEGADEGLGPDASMRCFYDAWGEPRSAWFEDWGQGLRPILLGWAGISVWDFQSNDGLAFGPDGKADSLSVY